jgi:ankyrin repeat protein
MYGGVTKLALEGDDDGVRRMLEEGTPVDVIANGRFNATPLQVAARFGHLPIVKLLLDPRANVKLVDHVKFSPVTDAARAGKWIVVKVLAEHGGDFDHHDATGKNGRDYLQRCRGKRVRAEIEAALARRDSAPSE